MPTRKYTVKYFNCEKPAKPYSFYVLCKGLNSGRPQPAPCANCFVFTCSSEADKDFFFTVCFALWKAKTFHPHLCGSVIEFLRIGEFKEILQQAVTRIQDCNTDFITAVEKVKAIEAKEFLVKHQLLLLAQLKIALLRNFLK